MRNFDASLLLAEQVVEQIIDPLVISDAMSLMYCHCNDCGSGILVDVLQLI